MRRLLKLDDKKGLSIMIGYVILISIAIGLSVMVYQFIVHYIPDSEEVSCPEGVSLSLRDVYCNAAEYNLTFNVKNSGLFSVDGFRIRVNDREGSNIGVHVLAEDFDKLEPGEIFEFSVDYRQNVSDGLFQSNLKLLEVQPFYGAEGKVTYCRSVISDLDCSRISEICGSGRDYDNDGLYDCDDPDCRFSHYCSEEDNQLMAHYTFDFDAGDYSFYNNHGSIIGSPSFVDGYLGDAIELNGVDEYVEVTDSDSISLGAQDYTISALISPSDISSFSAIVSKLNDGDDKEYAFSFTGDGGSGSSELQLDVENSNDGQSVTSTGPLVANDWQHVVVVFDSDTFSSSFYHEGVFQATSVSPTPINALPDEFDDPLNIGRWGSAFYGSIHHFEGKIDEVRIYNYSMSETEVEELYEFYKG